VVPTLAAGEPLRACLESLRRQTIRDFEVIVVDNSGQGLAQGLCEGEGSVRIRLIENRENAGFGAAVNQGFRASSAPYLATLNDDAVARPPWLAALVEALDTHPEAGMCASRVLLGSDDTLDSAGMLLARDGSSKQRGHLHPAVEFADCGEAFFPSGSAALYRRKMLDEIDAFDASFFLYCEDSDLGLRARWAGWSCRYAPAAQVEHAYSATGGRTSPQKAYLVERNRLRLVMKDFPAGWVAASFVYSLKRYCWHLAYLIQGKGKAAEYARSGHSGGILPVFVLQAHLALLRDLPRLLAQRAAIRRTRRISVAQFRELAARYSIPVREVAML
jgi:GT2 family glycosyltransferase